MGNFRKYFNLVIIAFFFVSIFQTNTQAAMVDAPYNFKENLSKEINQYIKKFSGSIAIEYYDLTTGETYQNNATKAYVAASTIKLPLAMYIMELADQEKIDLNQKLTYKKHHYVGGSGVLLGHKVGSKYTIKDLLRKSMVFSDNIAYSMLKEKVGEKNYVKYMKKLGATYSSRNALSNTSAHDLILYVQQLYKLGQTTENGNELNKYLQQTIYNETIPAGVKGVKVAHKVGMIPMYQLSHDVGIVYDESPYAIAVMTKGFSYEKSKKIIADISRIVNKHHIRKADYIKVNSLVAVYSDKNAKFQVATIDENEVLKITGDYGDWIRIELGKTRGYIQAKSLKRYTDAQVKMNNQTLKFDQIVRTLNNDTAVLHKPTVDSTPFARLSKGLRISVAKINENYYGILIGNRVGYIKAEDVEVQ
ncbi:beta-lactamase class A [Ureibacillus xyleni]|uniref:Beta-lactamase class A n=1 Tax=Ureibacillus xyleni TaxID=614648 RepID=A0A285SXV6_9BACL|nr:serine hydrolase [Ureibacillus xyleni]SOC13361.1 beta-lactamase class A [Ureibacillus xyleni]